MDFGFLFWVVLVGLIVASLQDLKRREVDNWLNHVILFFGVSYVVLASFIEKDFMILLYLGVLLLLFYGLMHAFYYARVFAGGDAKLLFALTPFFLATGFRDSFINSGVFILFLLVAGSVYGFIYSLVLYFKNIRKVNSVFLREVKKYKKSFGVSSGISLLLILLSILFSSISYAFIFLGLFLFVMVVFYIFAISLERVVMVREVSGKNLHEGDWLEETVRVGRKTIEPCWDGLSKEDLKLLFRKKKVFIKDGIPFVPSFLIAFILYFFFREFLLERFFGFF